MRAWHILLIVIPFCGFLEYQVLSLSNRVDTVHRIVQGLSVAEGVGKNRNSSDNSVELSTLEEELKRLTAQVDRIRIRLADGSDTELASDTASLEDPENRKLFSEKVLSVINSEVQRIRDIQLKRNRDSLVKYRKAAVREFAIKQGLTAGQESALQTILEDEVDKMVEILRDVNWENAPPTFMAEWTAMLAQTNDKIQDILNADQMSMYLYLRHLELQAMQGWLPKTQ
jgi:hypothetical protein